MKGLKQRLQEIDLKVHELTEKVSLLKSFESLTPADLSHVENISDNLSQLSRRALTSWKNWHETEHLEIGSMSELSELLQSMVEKHSELLDMEINFQSNSSFKGHIYADLNNVEKVLRKTLKNSKSSQASKVQVVLEDLNDFITVRINDNGEGIERLKLDELNSESCRLEGQGQYIKEKIYGMGAQVFWNSIEGIGSSCILNFQICSVDEVKKVSEQKRLKGMQKHLNSNSGIKGSHIMIVDDSRVTLKLFEDLFEAQGAKVELFSRPDEALEYLSDNRPDCLIVDYEMPVMNGIELVKRVRAHKTYSDLPILMLTSREDDETIVRCIQGGAVDYIFKTTNVQVIISKLNSTLRQVKIRKELASLQKVAAAKSVIVTLNHEFNNIITILMGRL